MRTNFEAVALDRRDNGILLVTLNRPEAANAMNTQMGLDLMELFEGKRWGSKKVENALSFNGY